MDIAVGDMDISWPHDRDIGDYRLQYAGIL